MLGQLKDAGYDLGPDLNLDELQGADGADGLIHRLIAAGGHDVDWLTDDQLAGAVAKISLSTYAKWFGKTPESLQQAMIEAWGEAPGSLYVDQSGPEPAIALAALQFGNVVLMIQPPRGFGENPVAIYHDPDMAPSHHYLAAYRWLEAPEEEGGFGAHAVVHLGKHGTLEWLPGKGIGMAADCAPDAVLGNLPLVYPFIVNDPGEGTQAKRRGHAVIVDHLVPPMARAETYGDMAKLEYLLDEYATVSALDPDKVPTLRAQIWTLIQAAQLHHDLHTSEKPEDEEFDEFVLHLDGYLCEIKDVQIRDGLHILGGGPDGEARVNLVLAVLRAQQMWGGVSGAVPGLRAALGGTFGVDEAAMLADPGAAVPELADLATLADLPAVSGADGVDLLESVARKLVVGMETLSWDAGKVPVVIAEVLGREAPQVQASLQFAADEVVPRLARTGDELTNVLRALDGRFVEAGPSGSPTRGLVNVLPTGRNFYAVDPKAIPSRNAWDVGVALADSLLARHKSETGEWPRSVGLTIWGTSAMRTQGDDLAEVLWLLGCRPVWDEASRRVTGFEVVPLDELGRPRVDVTIRISGFFRDAFPHVVSLLDEAVRTVAALDEDADSNYLRAHVDADVAAGNDLRSSTARVFGSKPGSYGAGLLPLVDARNWRTDAELAEVYAVWGGYAYGKDLDGAEAAAVDGACLRTDPGRGQERGHPRARHHGFRRLLPVPRRHGRDGPASDRLQPEGVHRRLRRTGAGEDADARGGDEAGLPGPGREPAVDGGDAAARVQGRLRDGGDGGLPVRVRRHRGRGRRLDVRDAHHGVRREPGDRRVLPQVEPLGTARDRRAAARSGSARAVVRAECRGARDAAYRSTGNGRRHRGPRLSQARSGVGVGVSRRSSCCCPG